MTPASAEKGSFLSVCSFPFILLVFLSLILILRGSGLRAEGQRQKKIMIVSSYERARPGHRAAPAGRYSSCSGEGRVSRRQEPAGATFLHGYSADLHRTRTD